MAKKKRKQNKGAARQNVNLGAPRFHQGKPLVRRGEPQVHRGEPQVHLSQCMIVKNEEKNIEKALSWGKGIVCEQIVVDTGSTDDTIMIAEHMGAKVLHFEWINDFAAAKNFAIEQATGDWIAFLDADEYFTETDVKNVLPFLEHIRSNPKMHKEYLAVCCPWVQLNDEGRPKEILAQERLFRNLPNVRYTGRIHERLTLEPKDVVVTKDFSIMHTGYTGESFIVTGKAGRNIELLRAELEDNPDDINMKMYLAESLKAEGNVEGHTANDPETVERAKEKIAQADALFKEAKSRIGELIAMHKQTLFDYFLGSYSNSANRDDELDKLCELAYREFPKEPKNMCYYAMMLNKKGEHKAAFDVLKKCEAHISRDMESSLDITTTVTRSLAVQMVIAAQGLGDLDTLLQYAEVLLLTNKTDENILVPYISTIMRRYADVSKAVTLLSRVYDLSDRADLLLIARAAKNCGAIELARRIVEMATG